MKTYFVRLSKIYLYIFSAIFSIIFSISLNSVLWVKADVFSLALEDECKNNHVDKYTIRINLDNYYSVPKPLRVEEYSQQHVNIDVSSQQAYPGFFGYTKLPDNYVFSLCTEESSLVLDSYCFASDLGFILGYKTLTIGTYSTGKTRIAISTQMALDLLGKKEGQILDQNDLIELSKLTIVINDGTKNIDCSIYSLFDLTDMPSFAKYIVSDFSIVIHDSEYSSTSYVFYLVTTCGRIRNKMIVDKFGGLDKLVLNELFIQEGIDQKVVLNSILLDKLDISMSIKILFYCLTPLSFFIFLLLIILSFRFFSPLCRKNTYLFFSVFCLLELIKLFFFKSSSFYVCNYMSRFSFELLLYFAIILFILIKKVRTKHENR